MQHKIVLLEAPIAHHIAAPILLIGTENATVIITTSHETRDEATSADLSIVFSLTMSG